MRFTRTAKAEKRHTPRLPIGLEGAKNEQFGRGAWRTMHSSGDSLLCPIRALHHIRKARKSLNQVENTHLCTNLGSATVATALKKTAKAAGVLSGNYSAHSIRIGGATALSGGGADRLAINMLGRWISNCFEEYLLQAAIPRWDSHARWFDAHAGEHGSQFFINGAAHHALQHGHQPNTYTVCPNLVV